MATINPKFQIGDGVYTIINNCVSFVFIANIKVYKNGDEYIYEYLPEYPCNKEYISENELFHEFTDFCKYWAIHFESWSKF